MAGKVKSNMKTISVILVLLVIALSLPVQADDKSAADVRSVHLCIILDCGATSQRSWDMLKTTAIETLYSLNPSDRVEVIAAYPFKTYLQIDAAVSAEDKGDYEKMAKKLAALDKELLFGSDMSRAVEAAYQHLDKNGHGRKCCVILTSGKLNDRHVKEIRQLGLAFKARGWPLCIVCDKEQANRSLLVAANNREFDIQFTDKTSLPDWIGNIRVPLLQKRVLETKIQEKEPVLKIHDKRPSKPEPGKIVPPVTPVETAKSPIEVKIVELPREKAFGDANKPKVGQSPSKAKGKPDAVAADDKVNDSKKRKSSVPDNIPLAILLTMILGAIILVLCAAKSSPRTVKDEDKQYCLVAFVFDQRYDLGFLDVLGEITVGKGVGSTIYIDSETIENKHLRIFRNRNGLQVQNLALSPITVNGVELSHRRKTILDLPADIQLTDGVTVTLISEPLEIEKEANSHEAENI